MERWHNTKNNLIMSAFAFVIEKDRTVIASDGLLWAPGKGVISLDSRKVFTIGDSVAILWLGVGASALSEGVLDEIKQKQAGTPKEITNIVSKHLKHGFEHPEGQKILEEHQFWIGVLGYNPEPEFHLLFSDAPEGPFTPIELPVNPGDIGCRAYDLNPEETTFKKLYKLKYFPLYQNVETAVKGAFEEMVRMYEEIKDVGGEIFIDTITKA